MTSAIWEYAPAEFELLLNEVERQRTALQTLTDKVEALEPRPIDTAPKDGTPILVFFDRPGLGWMRVTWDDPHGDGDYAIWCVDDNKHGPYPLRGYSEGDDLAWMPLPAALTKEGKSA